MPDSGLVALDLEHDLAVRVAYFPETVLLHLEAPLGHTLLCFLLDGVIVSVGDPEPTPRDQCDQDESPGDPRTAR